MDIINNKGDKGASITELKESLKNYQEREINTEISNLDNQN